jgi:hypothetical protein
MKSEKQLTGFVLKFVLGAVLVALGAIAAFACPVSAKCPVHDMDMYFTGQSKSANGHFFQLYHCPQGDEYWVRCD